MTSFGFLANNCIRGVFFWFVVKPNFFANEQRHFRRTWDISTRAFGGDNLILLGMYIFVRKLLGKLFWKKEVKHWSYKNTPSRSGFSLLKAFCTWSQICCNPFGLLEKNIFSCVSTGGLTQLYCMSSNSSQGEFFVLSLRFWNFTEWFLSLKVDIVPPRLHTPVWGTTGAYFMLRSSAAKTIGNGVLTWAYLKSTTKTEL